jgi:hypothetical protein
MTLMDAPKFDAAKARRRVRMGIAAAVLVVLIGVFGVAGFLLGHGWFFNNVPTERHVATFLHTVQSGDMDKAYAIWENDPDWKQHPDQYLPYGFPQFRQDWGPGSDGGDVKSFHVDISKRNDSGQGIIIAVKLNGNPKPVFLFYQRSTKRMSFSPVELEY